MAKTENLAGTSHTSFTIDDALSVSSTGTITASAVAVTGTLAWGGGSAIASSNSLVSTSSANTFTQSQTISLAAPQLFFVETGVTAQNTTWSWTADGETFTGRLWNDAIGAQEPWISVDRTANNADTINFNGITSISMNGTTPMYSIGGEGAGDGFVMIHRYNNAVGGPDIGMYHSRSATINTHTILQDADEIGSISFYASDGTSTPVKTARIIGKVDGTVGGATDLPSRIEFHTTPDGSATAAERLRISNDGSLRILSTASSASVPALRVGDTGSTASLASLSVVRAGLSAIVMRNTTNSVEAFIQGSTATGQLGTNTNHAMEILSNGSTRASFHNDEIDLTANALDFNGDADISGKLIVNDAIKVQGQYDTALTGVHSFIDVISATTGRFGSITTGGTPAPLYIWGSTVTIQTDSATPTDRLTIEADGSWNVGGGNGTAGQVLTSNGSSSSPSWQDAGGSSTVMTVGGGDDAAGITVGQTYMVVKDAEETRTDTTPATDSDIVLTNVPIGTYTVEYSIMGRNNAAAGISVVLSTPSLSLITSTATAQNMNGTGSFRTGDWSGSPFILNGVATDDEWSGFGSLILTTSASGTIAFSWNQQTDTGTSTMYRGTWMKLTRLI